MIPPVSAPRENVTAWGLGWDHGSRNSSFVKLACRSKLSIVTIDIEKMSEFLIEKIVLTRMALS